MALDHRVGCCRVQCWWWARLLFVIHSSLHILNDCKQQTIERRSWTESIEYVSPLICTRLILSCVTSQVPALLTIRVFHISMLLKLAACTAHYHNFHPNEGIEVGLPFTATSRDSASHIDSVLGSQGLPRTSDLYCFQTDVSATFIKA